jgi:cytochrome c5
VIRNATLAIVCAAIGVIGVLALAGCQPASGGQALVQQKCNTNCHGLDKALSFKSSDPAQWSGIIAQMKAAGMEVTPEQEKALVDYLSKQ